MSLVADYESDDDNSPQISKSSDTSTEENEGEIRKNEVEQEAPDSNAEDINDYDYNHTETGLPSAAEAFKEVTGPPEFLNSILLSSPTSTNAYFSKKNEKANNMRVIAAEANVAQVEPNISLIAPPDDKFEKGEGKKRSVVKDKEKVKRMKGQSSHASWKSETEMQLRQTFD